jgi:FkbM family methyltransferase
MVWRMRFRLNVKQMLLRLAFLIIERNSASLARRYPRMVLFSFDYIGSYINAYGRYENASLEVLRELLVREGITSTALDVGANIGNHTVFFAEFFERVVALEPNPATYAVLQLNTQALPNVTCLRLGASSAPATLRLRVNARNMGDSRVVCASAVMADGEDASIAIDVVPLDSIEGIQGSRIGLIKLDVQGHELDVIRGLSDTLQQQAPLIAFEQEAVEIVDGTSPTLEEIRRAGYAYLYAVEHRPSVLSPTIPGILRIPLELLEIVMRGDGRQRASIRAVDVLEHRQYRMLLAAKRPIHLTR